MVIFLFACIYLLELSGWVGILKHLSEVFLLSFFKVVIY